MAVFLLGLGATALLYGAWLVSEQPLLESGRISTEFLLFDAVSAVGTAGLSTGAVASLSAAGRLLAIAGMLVGRVGPLSMALLVGLRHSRQKIQFPEEEVVIG